MGLPFLMSLADTDAIFEYWAVLLDELAKAREELTDAELNYKSMLAHWIKIMLADNGITVATQLAKGEPEVIKADRALSEKERLVRGKEEAKEWLKERNIDLRIKDKHETEIIG